MTSVLQVVVAPPRPALAVTVPAASHQPVTFELPAKTPLQVVVGGRRGPAGEAGSGSTEEVTKIAGVNLSGQRVVTTQSDGTVVYASNTDVSVASKPLWLTLNAALAGSAVTVLSSGELTEPGWAWTPGVPIFLGANGTLTQTPPTVGGGAAFVQQVGSAEKPTEIFFAPRTAIVLG